MKLTLHPTTKIVELIPDPNKPTQTVAARVWEGETATGIKVNCFVTRIVPLMHKGDPRQKQFQSELEEMEPPSITADAWPTRLVL